MKKYVAKPKEVNAAQFLGHDEGLPQWVSVKGIKLSPEEREAEFYNENTQDYPRAKYFDWIVWDQNGNRWIETDRQFKENYFGNFNTEEPTADVPKKEAPIVEGHTLLGLGFR